MNAYQLMLSFRYRLAVTASRHPGATGLAVTGGGSCVAAAAAAAEAC